MKPKYIIAVSGGVDSVVLLHKIMTHRERSSSSIPNPQSSIQYIVSHFDHGIRKESAQDAEFVHKLANKYELKYERGSAELGEDTSEEEARKARYDFLFACAKKHRASGVIVAHHQDDVIETMVLNILRGTTARGLIGFTRQGILRPLLNMTKQEILDYAKSNGLKWREDSTNKDEEYLRNYIRRNLVPKLQDKRDELLNIRNKVLETYEEMDTLLGKLMVQTVEKGELIRSRFVGYPYSVQKELMATYMKIQGVVINSQMVERAVLATKVLQPGKHIQLAEGYELHSNKKSVSLTKKE